MKIKKGLSADSCVIVFVKYPVAGKVKTRLAESAGIEVAAGLYKCCVEDVLLGIKVCHWPIRIYFDPSQAKERFSDWLGSNYSYFPQRNGDIGERMKHAFEEVFKDGISRAVLIGSDIPDLPTGFLERAISAMTENDAVIGPSSDGGYYLIGFTKENFLPEVFEKISWGTDAVLKQTIEVFERHKRTFSLLPEWHDIDTIEDVRSMMLRNRVTIFSGSKTYGFCREHGLGVAEVKR